MTVRSALAAARAGRVDAAVVYRHRRGLRAHRAGPLPRAPADGPRIRYPVAVIAGPRADEAAQQFVGFLLIGRGRDCLRERPGCGLRGPSMNRKGAEHRALLGRDRGAGDAVRPAGGPWRSAGCWPGRVPRQERGRDPRPLPLVLPPVAIGLLLRQLLRPRGSLGPAARCGRHRGGLHLAGGRAGHGRDGLPLLVRTARAGFERSIRRSSRWRTLGAGPLRSRRLTLPLARRALLAGGAPRLRPRPRRVRRHHRRRRRHPRADQTLSLAIFGLTEPGEADAGVRLLVSIVSPSPR